MIGVVLAGVLAVAPVEVGDTDTEPADDAAPVERIGSVVVTLVGNTEPAAFITALEGRLGPRGIVALVGAERDFSPWPAKRPSDCLLEVWIVVPESGSVRIVVADPSHEHVIVRTVPHGSGTPSIVTIEETALIVEEAAAMAAAGDPWPQPEVVERAEIEVVRPPEEPTPEVVPEPEPAHRGLSVMANVGGIGVASDEFGHPRFAISNSSRIGWVFGPFEQRPALRISAEAELGSAIVPLGGDDVVSLMGLLARSRVGGVVGFMDRVWLYGTGAIGSGLLLRRVNDRRATVSSGILGSVGAGVTVSFVWNGVIGVEVAATGNPSRVGHLSAHFFIGGYLGKRRRRR